MHNTRQDFTKHTGEEAWKNDNDDITVKLECVALCVRVYVELQLPTEEVILYEHVTSWFKIIAECAKIFLLVNRAFLLVQGPQSTEAEAGEQT